jgi:hypothetical protein
MLQGQVNTQELQKGQSQVEFYNYEGPVTRIDTRAQIRGIGYTLGTAVRDGAGRSGAESRYFVIHGAADPEGGRLEADIFGLGASVGVDHIRNLRLIIQGYLEGAYAYSVQDAALLAQYITIYNAVYRGNWAYFSEAYKASVLQHISPDKAGLSLRFNEWPGKTLILIPLGIGSAGSLSAIDTTSISDATVLEELRKEGDLSVDQRKDMVDFKEREADAAELEAQRQFDLIVEEEARLAEERAALEGEQERLAQEAAAAEAAQEEGELSPEEAEETARERAAQEAAVQEREQALQEQEAALAAQREQAEQLEAFAEQKREEAQQDREEIAGDQQGLMDTEESEDHGTDDEDTAEVADAAQAQEGGEEAAEDSDGSSGTEGAQEDTPEEESSPDSSAAGADDGESDEADESGDAVGPDGADESGDAVGPDEADESSEDAEAVREQSMTAVENAQVPGLVGMALTGSASSQGTVVKVNPSSGEELKRTGLDTINIRTVTVVDQQIVAVAGEGNSLRLVAIDPDSLEVLHEGETEIHGASLLWVIDQDIYGIIRSGGNAYLARFDTALTLQAQSEIPVHPYGTVLFHENMLSTQNGDGKAVILDRMDLLEIK